MFAFHNNKVIKYSRPIESDFYDALLDGKYLITYRFDEEKENIVYEAFILSEEEDTDSTLPKYVSFILLSNGEVDLEPKLNYHSNKYNNFNDYAMTLFYYINQSEHDINNEKQYLEKYKEIAKYIEPFFSLSPEEMKLRKATRDDFLELVNSLSSSYRTQDNVLAHLTPSILSSYLYDTSKLDLRIGFPNKRTYKIQSIAKFINSVNSEETISYGKECAFKHSYSSFDKVSQKLLDLISQKSFSYSYYGETSINLVTLENIIEIYQGEKILFAYQSKDDRIRFDGSEEEYSVSSQDEQANIAIDEFGKLVVTPEIKKENTYIKLKRKYLLLDKTNHVITLLSFKSDVVKKIFDYLLEHSSINYDYIEDIFADKLIPLVQDNLEIDQKYQEDHQDSLFKINYYVDISDDEKLIVKTTFTKGRNEINKDELNSNKVYESKYNTFLALLASMKLEENGVISDEDTILSLLTNNIATLSKVADVFISDRLQSLTVKKAGQFSIKSEFKMGWIDILLYSKDYSEEEIKQILDAYKKKRRFIKIGDNLIDLKDDNIETLASFADDFNLKGKEEAKVPLHELFKLSSYADKLEVSYDDKIKEILDDIKNYEQSSFEVDSHYKNILRPYQVQAYKWLMSLKKYHLSGILADDMGLGKTLEMISFITSFDKNEPILIVTPKNVIYNWENEFKIWDANQKVKIIIGDRLARHHLIKRIKKDEKVVYITSYDALRIDVEEYQGIHFALMILDEAQYIKNVSALKTKAVKAIDSEYRYALTGTPIENSLVDLWSIFDFLMPNYLYGFNLFQSEYVNLVMEDNIEATKRLKAKIKPFILRRIKDNVLKELPPKSESLFMVDMVENQRKLYDVELAKVKNGLQDKGKIQILALLTRLRELCIDPSMLYENFEELSGKFSSVLDLLKEALAGDHKVLIFSAFTKSLDHLHDILSEENIQTYYINGATSASERVNIAKSFNKNDDVKIVLISLKAGGVGLNLTGADIVIHLDPWWNVAAENQASDRAHRIGQKRPVTIIKMVTKDSIEEKVINLQKKKAELVNAVISNKDSTVSSLSDEDISYLLS